MFKSMVRALVSGSDYMDVKKISRLGKKREIENQDENTVKEP